MNRSYLAAAFLSALALTLFVTPDAFAALVHVVGHGADAHAFLSHTSLASIGLVALRGRETDLVARAAAKLGEITDQLAPEAIRAIEAEHGKILSDVAGVRSQIVEAERAAAADGVAIRNAERERISGIRAVARKLGLKDELIDKAIADDLSLDAFRTLAIDAAAGRQAEASFTAHVHGSDPGHRSYAQPKEPLPKGTNATRAMLALAATRGDRRSAADFVSTQYGSEAEVVARALSTSIGSAGGFLLPPAMSSEVIELLRPASAVMALGPIIMPMPNGNMSIPRLAGGASASYVGENQTIGASQETFGMVQLSAKKLTALVPISNDMIRFPNIQTDGIVRDDLVKSVATRADLAFIRGPGTQYSPRGLRSFASDTSLAGANVIVAQAVVSLANVTIDAGKAELALMSANVSMSKPGWIMAPRTLVFLMNLRDGLGNLVYAAELAQGRWRGKPFKTTTQVPVNLAGTDANGNATTDATEIYLADFAEVIIGEAHGLELEVFNGGTYVDAGGNLVSGISNDQTVMRAIVQHDMNMRQIPAVAMLTNVRWF